MKEDGCIAFMDSNEGPLTHGGPQFGFRDGNVSYFIKQLFVCKLIFKMKIENDSKNLP